MYIFRRRRRPALDLGRTPIRDIRIILPLDLPVEAADIVGAGYLAVAAADAALVVHHDDPVGATQVAPTGQTRVQGASWQCWQGRFM